MTTIKEPKVWKIQLPGTNESVELTAKEKAKFAKMLLTKTEIHCLNPLSHATILLVGLELGYRGKLVKAKIIKAYSDPAKEAS